MALSVTSWGCVCGNPKSEIQIQIRKCRVQVVRLLLSSPWLTKKKISMICLVPKVDKLRDDLSGPKMENVREEKNFYFRICPWREEKRRGTNVGREICLLCVCLFLYFRLCFCLLQMHLICWVRVRVQITLPFWFNIFAFCSLSSQN